MQIIELFKIKIKEKNEYLNMSVKSTPENADFSGKHIKINFLS